MGPQQRNARWWRGSTAADSIIEGDNGPTAKGTPCGIPCEHTCEQNASITRATREHNASTTRATREHNASGTLAAREPIDTAKTPFFPSLIDGSLAQLYCSIELNLIVACVT